MPAGVGVPIRLVRNDGELIPLLAESITMTVDRLVGSMAMPFTGSTRFGMDLNMSKAAIVVQGVLVDDGVSRQDQGSFSTCNIDFSLNAGYLGNWISPVSTLATTSPSTYDQIIQLLDKDGNNHKMRLTNALNVGTAPATDAGDTSIMLVYVGNSTTPAQVAGALVAAINQTTHPTGGPTLKPGNVFTAEQHDSNIASAQAGELGVNSRVSISHDTKGDFGGSTPNFNEWDVKDTAGPNATPYHTPFRDGNTSAPTKSAGDKAMDLWGSLNNMNDGGIFGSIMASFQVLGQLDEARQNGVQGGTDLKFGDYVIGIQIPYHSLVQATGGEDYVQRNFFMPTGAAHNKLSKDSTANTQSVDVEFDPHGSDGDYTGIKGTVQQFVVTYDAGETVYNYQMTFLPIDYII